MLRFARIYRPATQIFFHNGPMNTVMLFNIPIRNVSLLEGLTTIKGCLLQQNQSRIFFVNAHCVNAAQNDPEYLKILRGGTHVFADGVGMRVASLLFGRPLVDNVNGTDLYPLLCEALEGTGIRIFLLGSEPGVVEEVRRRALRQYPALAICGIHHGHFAEGDRDLVVAAIRDAGTDLLLVGMGVPRQEKWVAENLGATRAKVALGVGGLFDVYSGKVWRPPMLMRRLGLEWFGRLIPGRGEPRRLWRRYLLGNFRFLWLALRLGLRERRRSRTHPAGAAL